MVREQVITRISDWHNVFKTVIFQYISKVQVLPTHSGAVCRFSHHSIGFGRSGVREYTDYRDEPSMVRRDRGTGNEAVTLEDSWVFHYRDPWCSSQASLIAGGEAPLPAQNTALFRPLKSPVRGVES